MRDDEKHRHCERSEAISGYEVAALHAMTSPTLLAMTNLELLAFNPISDIIAANLVASNTFSDPATSNWWTAAGLADVNIPSSNARTVPSGGPGVSNPLTPTSLLAVFKRRPPNGTWKLRSRDGFE